ncbi:hypothetical protein COO20_23835 [Thalassospira marina]|uniref:Uncharacterized protein n=1 Tax=Thalassospira marina TaxID=2048283 RepID=A0A2N3KEM7_9PROT|nr:hypothetical protein COO20_23835 [Thalassospira marina]
MIGFCGLSGAFLHLFCTVWRVYALHLRAGAVKTRIGGQGAMPVPGAVKVMDDVGPMVEIAVQGRHTLGKGQNCTRTDAGNDTDNVTGKDGWGC